MVTLLLVNILIKSLANKIKQGKKKRVRIIRREIKMSLLVKSDDHVYGHSKLI